MSQNNAELAAIPFAEGRIVWKAAGVDEAIGRPVRPVGQGEPRTVEWLLGEALTCLYVGLCRYHRGEKLSAQRFPDTAVHLPAFVQGYERSCQSALALLAFLDQHFAVNGEIKARILALLG
jgi:hypothetical protein